MKIVGIINILKVFYIFIKDNRNSTLILLLLCKGIENKKFRES